MDIGSLQEPEQADPVESRLEAQGYRYGWLLWLACAIIACLPPLGVSPFASLALGLVPALAWLATNIALDKLSKSFVLFVLTVFFREQVRLPCFFQHHSDRTDVRSRPYT